MRGRRRDGAPGRDARRSCGTEHGRDDEWSGRGAIDDVEYRTERRCRGIDHDARRRGCGWIRRRRSGGPRGRGRFSRRWRRRSIGDYVFTFESANANMGASAQDYSSHKPWTSATCPAAGATNEIDGVYASNNPMYPVPLKAGQKIVVWVSVASFSTTKTSPYKLTVTKK